ncbi:MAG: hypothetical protein WBA16_00930 [Nonlabens sp.]
MKKKIAADLTSLAHRILQLKRKDDLEVLLDTSRELYEKLTVLAYAQKHLDGVKPTASISEVEEQLDAASTPQKSHMNEEEVVRHNLQDVMEEAEREANDAFEDPNLSKLFVPVEDDEREEMDLPGIATIHKMVEEMPEETVDRVETPSPAKEVDLGLSSPDRFNKNDMENIVMDYQTMPVFERKEEHTHEKESDPVPQVESNNTVTPGATEVGQSTVGDSSGPENHNDISDRIEALKNFNYSDDTFERKVSPQDTEEEPSMEAQDFKQNMADPQQSIMNFEHGATLNSEQEDRPLSLNDQLNKGLKIGMNDRIGFIKHLFNGNDNDYSRVISQLNTSQSPEDARRFIETMVKPDYNGWEGKESYATRFMDLVERSF